MTARERARRILERWRTAPSGPHDKLADIISEILSAERAAYRTGQERMRERCIVVAKDMDAVANSFRSFESAIRALPLEVDDAGGTVRLVHGK